jgi:hypothetical protein
MRSALLMALLLAAALPCAQAAAPVAAPPAASMVVVRALGDDERLLRSGGGVVTAPGQVTTNCHLLARARAVQIRYDDVIYVATLQHADAERDLCQLRAARLPAPAVRLSSVRAAYLGQRVSAIAGGPALSTTEGEVTELRQYNGVPVIRTTATVSQGVSGAALFDGEGRLLGITTILVKESPAENYAIAADAIAEVARRSAEALERRAAAPAPAAPTAPQPAVSAVATIDAKLAARLPQVGDQWKYVLTDKWTGVTKGPYNFEVTAVSATEIRETVRIGNRAGEERVFNREPQFAEPGVVGIAEFAPFLQAFGNLDTAAGWNGISLDAADSNKWTYSGQVVGAETVNTPAGTFNATRLEFSGTRRRSTPGGTLNNTIDPTMAKYVIWYAPDVKRPVKISIEVKNWTGTMLDRDELELIEFKLRPAAGVR